MICGICHKTISKEDIEAKRYTYSSWTGNNYHVRNCDTPALKRARVAEYALIREAKRAESDAKLVKKRKRRSVGR